MTTTHPVYKQSYIHSPDEIDLISLRLQDLKMGKYVIFLILYGVIFHKI